MKIKIHRGSHQIGGSITEIYTGKTHMSCISEKIYIFLEASRY